MSTRSSAWPAPISGGGESDDAALAQVVALDEEVGHRRTGMLSRSYCGVAMEASGAGDEDGSGHRWLRLPRRLVRDRAAAPRLPGAHDRARPRPRARGARRDRLRGRSRRPPHRARRRPARRRGLGRGGRRLRLRPPRRLPVPAEAAEGPRRADRAGARRDPARAAARASTPASSGSSSPPRWPRSPAAAKRCAGGRWTSGTGATPTTRS